MIRAFTEAPLQPASSFIFPRSAKAGLFGLRLAAQRRLGQREDNDLFASYGADIVVQAQYRHAGDLSDQHFQDWSCRFDEMGPQLLEQGSPLLGGERLPKLLFGGGQDSLEADHKV